MRMYTTRGVIFMGGWVKQNKHMITITYEIVMLILISISVISIFVSDNPNPVFGYINTVIWVVFLVDITIRLIKAVSRWHYIKNNPFDIVSIIPLEDFFLLARFARVIKLFRYKNLIKRYLVKLNEVVKKYKIWKITTSVVIGLVILIIVVSYTGGYSIKETSIWVVRNFVQFNYFSELTEGNRYLRVLSVILKVSGLVYIGLIVNYLRESIEDKLEPIIDRLKKREGNKKSKG